MKSIETIHRVGFGESIWCDEISSQESGIGEGIGCEE